LWEVVATFTRAIRPLTGERSGPPGRARLVVIRRAWPARREV
jgi:hypothetical protein